MSIKKDLGFKIEDAYAMYLKGLSLNNVANEFGISRQMLHHYFKSNSLDCRPLFRKDFIMIDGLKFTINKDGYYECTTVDRLMLHNYNWEITNGKLPKCYEIHHIDLNKINNSIDNLMAVTPSEHTKIHASLVNGSGMNRKVLCVETGEVYDSIVQVGLLHNQHASNVSRYYIDGKRKLNGYTYERVN
jgi:hypothetical protein